MLGDLLFTSPSSARRTTSSPTNQQFRSNSSQPSHAAHGEQIRKRVLQYLISALAMMVVSACVSYVPRTVSVSASAHELVARSLSSPGLHDFVLQNITDPPPQWPPATWSPELLELAAFYFQPRLEVARSQWHVARAASVRAAERPNPSFTAGLERKSGSRSISPWVTTLSLDIPVETAGKRRERMKAAMEESAATAADLEQVVWDTRHSVRLALLDLVIARARKVSFAEQRAILDDIVSIYERRVIAGAAASPELAKAKIDAASAGSAAMLAEADEGDALARLSAAIGVPMEQIRNVAIAPPSLEPASPPVPPLPRLRELALLGRPDIIASAARYRAADSAYRLEIRRQYPDLHIGPGLGWDQGAFKWAAAATLEIPLFNRHTGAIAEAYARRELAASELLALQAKIAARLDAAFTDTSSASARVAQARRTAGIEMARFSAVRRQFEVGEIDRLALRSGELAEAVARGGITQTAGDLQRAVLSIENVLERPLSSAREEGAKE